MPPDLRKSTELFDFAKRFIPGGVNTSARLIFSPTLPLTFKRANGSHVWDADGNDYIDYVCGSSATILGHCHPKVNQRVWETIQTIDLIGSGTTEEEARVAEKICRYVPSAEKTLLCVSGSEATFNAVRLARAVTGRSDLIKFEGCYHGWHDYLLMNHYMTKGAKLGDRTPPSAGILQEALEHTHVVNFNRINEVDAKIREKRGKIAAVIVEPIIHNIGNIAPKPGFLEELRELTEHHGIILIFDEIITGFRHGLGGYQEKCGVTPDVTTLGKSIANGFPMAAICGREDLMDRFTTAGGDVFYLGTFNAHPVSTAASLATIEELEHGSVYEKIFRLGDRIRNGLQEISAQLGLKTYASGYGSVFVNYFMEPPVESYPDLLRNNTQSDLSFRRMMIERGILLSSRNIRRSVISASHSDVDIDTTLEKARESLSEILKLTK